MNNKNNNDLLFGEGLGRRVLAAFFSAGLIFSIVGCGGNNVVVEEEQEEEEEVVEEIDPQLLAQGRANWDAQCAFCHGLNGEGAAIDPSPVRPGECTVPDAGACEDADVMATYIAATMPPPGGACLDACAESTAALILTFSARAAAPVAMTTGSVDTAVSWMMSANHCGLVDCGDVSAVTQYIIDQTAGSADACVDDCAFQAALEISTAQ